jgi:hypothetical protein
MIKGMTNGKKVTFLINGKDASEYVPKHPALLRSDLFGGLGLDEIQKQMGVLSPAHDLADLAARFVEEKRFADATLGEFKHQRLKRNQ